MSENELRLSSSGNLDPKVIAFFLPQYYPFPENDLWWGEGFTEWTNVTKAKPLFHGHNQPRLPTDLGFYDLRIRSTRLRQIQLAKRFGIDGFCYYYYWFSGKRLLDLPVDAMLHDSEAKMPFCLCWANENWTRRWDAAEQEILISQKYQSTDDEDFIRSLLPFFADARYIRIDGKPLLIVYRPQHLPNAKKSADVWRNVCAKEGVGEINICAALTHNNCDYRGFGFDSAVEFPPHNLSCSNHRRRLNFYSRFCGAVVSYKEVAEYYLRQHESDLNVFKTVFPDWDNSARVKERALITIGASPQNYEAWLSQAMKIAKRKGQPLVFVNAWNEWAEGAYLEPDRRFGRGYLEATQKAKESLARGVESKIVDVRLADFREVGSIVSNIGRLFRFYLTLPLFSLLRVLRRFELFKALERSVRSYV